ncbi:MAG TPA: hypothetical protein PKE31_13900 [Pseudomonadota bacterium]|nr:hypothetical protein [Pseudomonadota bacterium]
MRRPQKRIWQTGARGAAAAPAGFTNRRALGGGGKRWFCDNRT